MEFQEVLHGQEHYCSLFDSRRLFQSLADPVEGCITRENLSANLQSSASATFFPVSAGSSPHFRSRRIRLSLPEGVDAAEDQDTTPTTTRTTPDDDEDHPGRTAPPRTTTRTTPDEDHPGHDPDNDEDHPGRTAPTTAFVRLEMDENSFSEDHQARALSRSFGGGWTREVKEQTDAWRSSQESRSEASRMLDESGVSVEEDSTSAERARRTGVGRFRFGITGTGTAAHEEQSFPSTSERRKPPSIRGRIGRPRPSDPPADAQPASSFSSVRGPSFERGVTEDVSEQTGAGPLLRASSKKKGSSSSSVLYSSAHEKSPTTSSSCSLDESAFRTGFGDSKTSPGGGFSGRGGGAPATSSSFRFRRRTPSLDVLEQQSISLRSENSCSLHEEFSRDINTSVLERAYAGTSRQQDDSSSFLGAGDASSPLFPGVLNMTAGSAAETTTSLDQTQSDLLPRMEVLNQVGPVRADEHSGSPAEHEGCLFPSGTIRGESLSGFYPPGGGGGSSSGSNRRRANLTALLEEDMPNFASPDLGTFGINEGDQEDHNISEQEDIKIYHEHLPEDSFAGTHKEPSAERGRGGNRSLSLDRCSDRSVRSAAPIPLDTSPLWSPARSARARPPSSGEHVGKEQTEQPFENFRLVQPDGTPDSAKCDVTVEDINPRPNDNSGVSCCSGGSTAGGGSRGGSEKQGETISYSPVSPGVAFSSSLDSALRSAFCNGGSTKMVDGGRGQFSREPLRSPTFGVGEDGGDGTLFSNYSSAVRADARPRRQPSLEGTTGGEELVSSTQHHDQQHAYEANENCGSQEVSATTSCRSSFQLSPPPHPVLGAGTVSQGGSCASSCRNHDDSLAVSVTPRSGRRSEGDESLASSFAFSRATTPAGRSASGATLDQPPGSAELVRDSFRESAETSIMGGPHDSCLSISSLRASGDASRFSPDLRGDFVGGSCGRCEKNARGSTSTSKQSLTPRESRRGVSGDNMLSPMSPFDDLVCTSSEDEESDRGGQHDRRRLRRVENDLQKEETEKDHSSPAITVQQAEEKPPPYQDIWSRDGDFCPPDDQRDAGAPSYPLYKIDEERDEVESTTTQQQQPDHAPVLTPPMVFRDIGLDHENHSTPKDIITDGDSLGHQQEDHERTEHGENGSRSVASSFAPVPKLKLPGFGTISSAPVTPPLPGREVRREPSPDMSGARLREWQDREEIPNFGSVVHAASTVGGGGTPVLRSSPDVFSTASSPMPNALIYAPPREAHQVINGYLEETIRDRVAQEVRNIMIGGRVVVDERGHSSESGGPAASTGPTQVEEQGKSITIQRSTSMKSSPSNPALTPLHENIELLWAQSPDTSVIFGLSDVPTSPGSVCRADARVNVTTTTPSHGALVSLTPFEGSVSTSGRVNSEEQHGASVAGAVLTTPVGKSGSNHDAGSHGGATSTPLQNNPGSSSGRTSRILSPSRNSGYVPFLINHFVPTSSPSVGGANANMSSTTSISLGAGGSGASSRAAGHSTSLAAGGSTSSTAMTTSSTDNYMSTTPLQAAPGDYSSKATTSSFPPPSSPHQLHEALQQFLPTVLDCSLHSTTPVFASSPREAPSRRGVHSPQSRRDSSVSDSSISSLSRSEFLLSLNVGPGELRSETRRRGPTPRKKSEGTIFAESWCCPPPSSSSADEEDGGGQCVRTAKFLSSSVTSLKDATARGSEVRKRSSSPERLLRLVDGEHLMSEADKRELRELVFPPECGSSGAGVSSDDVVNHVFPQSLSSRPLPSRTCLQPLPEGSGREVVFFTRTPDEEQSRLVEEALDSAIRLDGNFVGGSEERLASEHFVYEDGCVVSCSGRSTTSSEAFKAGRPPSPAPPMVEQEMEDDPLDGHRDRIKLLLGDQNDKVLPGLEDEDMPMKERLSSSYSENTATLSPHYWPGRLAAPEQEELLLLTHRLDPSSCVRTETEQISMLRGRGAGGGTTTSSAGRPGGTGGGEHEHSAKTTIHSVPSKRELLLTRDRTGGTETTAVGERRTRGGGSDDTFLLNETERDSSTTACFRTSKVPGTGEHESASPKELPGPGLLDFDSACASPPSVGAARAPQRQQWYQNVLSGMRMGASGTESMNSGTGGSLRMSAQKEVFSYSTRGEGGRVEDEGAASGFAGMERRTAGVTVEADEEDASPQLPGPLASSRDQQHDWGGNRASSSCGGRFATERTSITVERTEYEVGPAAAAHLPASSPHQQWTSPSTPAVVGQVNETPLSCVHRGEDYQPVSFRRPPVEESSSLLVPALPRRHTTTSGFSSTNGDDFSTQVVSSDMNLARPLSSTFQLATLDPQQLPGVTTPMVVEDQHPRRLGCLLRRCRRHLSGAVFHDSDGAGGIVTFDEDIEISVEHAFGKYCLPTSSINKNTSVNEDGVSSSSEKHLHLHAWLAAVDNYQLGLSYAEADFVFNQLSVATGAAMGGVVSSPSSRQKSPNLLCTLPLAVLKNAMVQASRVPTSALETWAKSVFQTTRAESQMVNGEELEEVFALYHPDLVGVHVVRAQFRSLGGPHWPLFEMLLDKSFSGMVRWRSFFDWCEAVGPCEQAEDESGASSLGSESVSQSATAVVEARRGSDRSSQRRMSTASQTEAGEAGGHEDPSSLGFQHRTSGESHDHGDAVSPAARRTDNQSQTSSPGHRRGHDEEDDTDRCEMHTKSLEVDWPTSGSPCQEIGPQDAGGRLFPSSDLQVEQVCLSDRDSTRRADERHNASVFARRSGSQSRYINLLRGLFFWGGSRVWLAFRRYYYPMGGTSPFLFIRL